MKQLHTSFVRPIFEYGSAAWDPQYATYVDMIDLVQKQSLIFSLRNFHWNYNFIIPPYTT